MILRLLGDGRWAGRSIVLHKCSLATRYDFLVCQLKSRMGRRQFFSPSATSFCSTPAPPLVDLVRVGLHAGPGLDRHDLRFRRASG